MALGLETIPDSLDINSTHMCLECSLLDEVLYRYYLLALPTYGSGELPYNDYQIGLQTFGSLTDRLTE